MHPDNEGWYEAEKVVDWSLAAKQQFEKDMKDPEPGERIIVRYTRPPSVPLVSLAPDAEPEDHRQEPHEGDESGQAKHGSLGAG
jgi:hypothetical protein